MHKFIIILTLIAAVFACDKSPGPDSISSHQIVTLNDCMTCHAPGTGVAPDPLGTGGSGTAGKHVAHVSSSGLSCDRCHYGYLSNPNHGNGVVNTASTGASPVIFDLLNSPPSSTATFIYLSGPPAVGNCSNVRCHVDTVGTPTTMDWYGPDVTFVLPNCSVCHNVPIGVRRQVLGAAGDFASNPSVTSHHVTGAADPSTSQCKLCHDQYHHMAGTVQLHQTSAGTRVTYDPVSPATLETFCLGCHNASGATFTYLGGTPLDPFNDGVTLGTVPYVASTTIASSWSGSSVHRSRGLTCAGTGIPNTGCHGSNGRINMHGSTVKGLLANSMNFQIPLSSGTAYTANKLVDWDYNNYKLCFDCHANYPAVTKEVVIGYRSGGVYDLKKAPTPYYTLGMQSLFRDRYIDNPLNYPIAWGGINQLYNDFLRSRSDTFLPLHNYHLLGFEANAFLNPSDPPNWLQWKYRGNPSQTGRITCTACHDVHGTVAPTIKSTHAELGLKRDYDFFGNGYAPFPGESYASIDPLISATTMSSYPMNCAVDCHGVRGQTSYWHTPNGD